LPVQVDVSLESLPAELIGPGGKEGRDGEGRDGIDPPIFFGCFCCLCMAGVFVASRTASVDVARLVWTTLQRTRALRHQLM